MLAHTPASRPDASLWDADAAAIDPQARFVRGSTLVSAATHSTLVVERLVAKHHAAAAHRAYADARAAGDKAAAQEAVRMLAVRFVIAETYGVTPEEIVTAAEAAR
jgi:hypothetical protein